MAYAGFEVLGAEDVHNELVKLAKSMAPHLRADEARKELDELARSLSRWSPKEVRLGTDVPKLEVRLSRASALVMVFPPRHRLLAVEASKDMEYCLEWAGGAGKYPVLVYYSRRGIMTTTAYLYLGNVMEDNNVGVLFVNGPPSEVAEVLEILESKGEYMPSENELIDFRF
ncbi:MAG: hypothetical protein ACP5HK_02005 [Acidilobus sp.]